MLWDFVIEANKKDLLVSAKDINTGGIAIALAKMAAVGDKGVDIDIVLENQADMFAESLSRAIVEVNPKDCDAFESFAKEVGITCINAGVIGGDEFSINNIVNMEMSELKDIYFNKFKQVIEQDL